MFLTREDLNAYIEENYPEVTDHRVDKDHWDLECTKCKVTRGFELTRLYLSGTRSRYSDFDRDFTAPQTYVFRCPVCKAFKQWLVYTIQTSSPEGAAYHYYRVTSVPNEGLEEISELPVEPESLRTAYRQAIRAMDANAHIAAAAMFRRALQIITRELLGAKPGNLANELREVVGKLYNGGVVSTAFGNVAYIIKEGGNQGAHPDADPDLLDFTAEDASDLQQIFMEMVGELFVIPAAKQKAKEDFMARRKIVPKTAETLKSPDKLTQ